MGANPSMTSSTDGVLAGRPVPAASSMIVLTCIIISTKIILSSMMVDVT